MAVEYDTDSDRYYNTGKDYKIKVTTEKSGNAFRYHTSVKWIPNVPNTVGVLTIYKIGAFILARESRCSGECSTIGLPKESLYISAAASHIGDEIKPYAVFVVKEITTPVAVAYEERRAQAEQYLETTIALGKVLNLSIDIVEASPGTFEFVVEKYHEANADWLREARLNLGE